MIPWQIRQIEETSSGFLQKKKCTNKLTNTGKSTEDKARQVATPCHQSSMVQAVLWYEHNIATNQTVLLVFIDDITADRSCRMNSDVRWDCSDSAKCSKTDRAALHSVNGWWSKTNCSSNPRVEYSSAEHAFHLHRTNYMFFLLKIQVCLKMPSKCPVKLKSGWNARKISSWFSVMKTHSLNFKTLLERCRKVNLVRWSQIQWTN